MVNSMNIPRMMSATTAFEFIATSPFQHGVALDRLVMLTRRQQA
jgi:hypothetical protein